MKPYELFVSEGEEMHKLCQRLSLAFRWNRSLIFFAVALASRWIRLVFEPFGQITTSTALEPAE